MMKYLSRRRGSALLIVLGFLAFIVVSGVSFAIYMRSERLASSNYHRTVAVRQLLKAGLAHAIEEVDYDIGNSLFPGLNNNNWHYRVFTPNGQIATDQTVPVMPLEGLAYLPPALVNEVRFQSRRTPTANWRVLNYDSGRYAYVAVNVSDFFDINKVRFSRGDLSLAYLYQNARGNGWEVPASTASTADTFLDRRGGNLSDVPFVSLQDFNVALASADPSGSMTGLGSPYFEYLMNGTAREFYGDDQSDTFKRARRGIFLTDSYQIISNRHELIDLRVSENQPFKRNAYSAVQSQGAIAIIANNTAHGGYALTGKGSYRGLGNELHPISQVNLFDYLDNDSIPLSLAVPNVERVPMIAAIDAKQMVNDLQFNVDEHKTIVTENTDDGPVTVTTTKYSLKINALGRAINTVAVYPFKYSRPDYTQNFRVQAAMRIFFAEKGARPRSAAAMVRDLRITEQEWQTLAGNGRVDNAGRFITLVSQLNGGSLSVSPASDHNNAVKDVPVMMPNIPDLDSNYLMEKVERKDASGNLLDVKYTSKFMPWNVNNNQLAEAQLATDPEHMLLQGKEYVPYVAVWVRICDGTDTVDLCPASFLDDSLNHISSSSLLYTTPQWGAGSGVPLLLVEGEQSKVLSYIKDATHPTGIVRFGNDGDSNLKPFDNKRAGFVAPDPRFNYCPEDMYTTDQSVSAANYVNMVEDKFLGRDGRDSDMFMTTSDQEYMQSVAEIAFLPRLQGLGVDQWDQADDPFSGKAIDGHPMATSAEDLKNNTGSSHVNSFWRTYRLYNQDDHQADDIFGIPIVNGINGVKVNPYSDIDRIRQAALANIPCDYYCASTNDEFSSVAKAAKNNIEERFKYAFNSLPGAKSPLEWQDVTNMTAIVFTHLRKAWLEQGKAWDEALEEMGWYESDINDHNRIFRFQLTGQSDDLDEIDRKMICSYLHDRLGCAQQLFLVFVRIEPTSFGTSTAELIPSHLGARAVALVWRNPYRTQEAQTSEGGHVPHSTRILFYHQFD